MDFYGYLTLENPTKSYNNDFPNNQRYVGYGDLDIKLKNNLKLHIQNFYSNSHDFSVNDFVIGLSYRYQIENFWIKPFLGLHHTYDTFYKGMNGYMTGWVFDYRFKLMGQNCSLFQWNEIEFGRNKKFYEDNGIPIGDGKSYGLNGALSLWWFITQSISSGLEYRYADHKLGNIEYQAGYTYTLKYNF